MDSQFTPGELEFKTYYEILQAKRKEGSQNILSHTKREHVEVAWLFQQH